MGRVGEIRRAVGKVPKVGPEQSPWFWTPDRGVGRKADPLFLQKLKELGEELAVSWNPIQERWQVWSRAPRIQHPLCQGWRLLFVVKEADGSYRPLDERTLARLYEASVLAHGSGKAYFQRIQDEMERDKERQRAQDTQDAIDMSMPFFDHSQIKVAMRGKSNGSKFATYHS